MVIPHVQVGAKASMETANMQFPKLAVVEQNDCPEDQTKSEQLYAHLYTYSMHACIHTYIHAYRKDLRYCSAATLQINAHNFIVNNEHVSSQSMHIECISSMHVHFS